MAADPKITSAIREAPPPRPRILCSFCGKTQDEVSRIVAGPSVNICDECIEVCVQVVCNDVPDYLPRVLGAIEDWRFHV